LEGGFPDGRGGAASRSDEAPGAVRFLPSLDLTDLGRASELVEAVDRLRGPDGADLVHGYVIGPALARTHGLAAVVRALRCQTRRPLIYDHRQGETDHPEAGPAFADHLAEAGIDEVILVPNAGDGTILAGPSLRSDGFRAWTAALRRRGIRVIISGGPQPDRRAERGSPVVFPTIDEDRRGLGRYAAALGGGVHAWAVSLSRPDLAGRIAGAIPPGDPVLFYVSDVDLLAGRPPLAAFPGRVCLQLDRLFLEAADPAAWLLKHAMCLALRHASGREDGEGVILAPGMW